LKISVDLYYCQKVENKIYVQFEYVNCMLSRLQLEIISFHQDDVNKMMPLAITFIGMVGFHHSNQQLIPNYKR